MRFFVATLVGFFVGFDNADYIPVQIDLGSFILFVLVTDFHIDHHVDFLDTFDGDVVFFEVSQEPGIKFIDDMDIADGEVVVPEFSPQKVDIYFPAAHAAESVKVFGHAPADKHLAEGVGVVLQDFSSHVTWFWLSAVDLSVPGIRISA